MRDSKIKYQGTVTDLARLVKNNQTVGHRYPAIFKNCHRPDARTPYTLTLGWGQRFYKTAEDAARAFITCVGLDAAGVAAHEAHVAWNEDVEAEQERQAEQAMSLGSMGIYDEALTPDEQRDVWLAEATYAGR